MTNHIHLDQYIDYRKITKKEINDIAEFLFYRLKGMYPALKIIVYLVYTEDGTPILDFSLCRDDEPLFYDLNDKHVTYFTS